MQVACAELGRVVPAATPDFRNAVETNPEVSLSQLFLDQVEATPDKIAVSDIQRFYTYRELSGVVLNAAAELARAGVNEGARVGMHLDRSSEFVVMMLACWRLGAGYVPLDPSYPPERLRFMIQDADISIVVSDTIVGDWVGATPVLSTHDLLARRLPAESPSPRPVVGPQQVAYILYTSGSTGRPKGVLVPHGGVSNILQYARTRFGIQEGDSVLGVTSFSFDVSVLEIMLPLISGARLHVVQRDIIQDSYALAAELQKRDATYLLGTPSLFDMMLGTGWRPSPELNILAAGEALRASTVRRLASARTVWNLYGPTEASIFCTCSRVDNADEITIGTPVANTMIEICNGKAEVGLDGVGEICVAGVGLALGYLGRPDLTAQRFTPSPADPNRTLYRTGDLGRWRPDGAIDYLGRSDDQIKLRGYRIELSGIEATIAEHPSVQQVAVTLESHGETDQLVANVVPVHGDDFDHHAVRRFLRSRLPAHEVPHRIRALSSLPLTSSGKVDRKALASHRRADAGHTSGSGIADIEQRLRAVWCAVLGVEDIAAADDFFEVGGDSLSAMRLVTRARQVRLPMQLPDLMEQRRFGALARRLTENARTVLPNYSESAEAVDESTGQVFPLLPSQHRFFAWSMSEPSHYNEPVLLNVNPSIDRRRLASSLVRLARRHPALRSRFRHAEAWPHVELGPAEESFPLDWHDLSNLPPSACEVRYRQIVDELQGQLNLESGPVCRASYFHQSHADDRLVLLFHHLVCDGVTFHTVAEDLTRMCGDPMPDQHDQELDEPPPSALHHANILRDFARSMEADSYRQHWLALPWEHVGRFPREMSCTARMEPEALRIANLTLDRESSRQVLRSTNRSTTAEEIILAAVADTIVPVVGTDTVALDVCRHGRWCPQSGVNVSRTVGWLASVAPYVIRVPNLLTPGQRLAAICRQVRMLQRIGDAWGPLRYLAPDTPGSAELSALPSPQIYVNFRGPGMQDLPLGGRLSYLAAYTGISRTRSQIQPYPVELRVDVRDHALSFSWSCNSSMFSDSELASLANRCAQSVRQFSAADNLPSLSQAAAT